ncbi:MAG: hypothetical protein MIO92_03755 [Methanosarcinaceae archaeon]|nr:hypothetical protein [Methanosarcinaceae archaeon]
MKIEITASRIESNKHFAYATAENREEVTTGFYTSSGAAFLRVIEMAKAVWGEIEIVEEV